MLENNLIIQLQKKDKGAFRQLYTDYSGIMYGIICSVVQDSHTAADALKHAFIKIWSDIDTFDSARCRLPIWLIGIARRAAMDKMKDGQYMRKETTGLNTLPALNESGIAQYADDDADYGKSIMEMMFQGQCSVQEAAADMALSEDAVKTQLRASFLRLRRMREVA